MLDNTYIVFSSDHGEMLGDHGAFTKGLPYDPSMRVPLLASGPGIAPGRTSEAMVELIDLNATICDLAGLPPQERVDARSFAPVLRGERAEHRDEIVSSLGHFRCVRSRDWKFVDNINDIPELYDMRNDPDELHNLAEEKPQERQKMNQRLNRRWLEGEWNI